MNDPMMLDDYGNLVNPLELMLRQQAERMQQGQVQRMPEPRVNYQAYPEPKQAQTRVLTPDLPTEQPAATPQQSMPSPRPSAPQTPAPSAPQQPQEPQGLLSRLLGDSDNRKRLGAELMMMSAAPQFQKMGASKLAGIEEAAKELKTQQQTQAQRNKTIEYLVNNGRKDLAEQVMAGLPPMEALKLVNVKPEASALESQYRLAKEQGYPGTFLEYQLALKKAGATSVSVGGANSYDVGTIPQGYRLKYDEQGRPSALEALPGGQPAQDQAEAAEAARKAAEQAAIKGTVVGNQVDKLITALDKGGLFNLPEAGIVGNVLGYLNVNQEAVDFKNTLAGIQGAVAFDTLQKMREASKTGGALGSVSEREIDLLISAYGALQQSSSPELLKDNLMTIKQIMTKIESDPVARGYLYGNSATTGSGAGTTPFTVTGKVE